MKKKLFAIYLGGRADGCNIELHDVVFIVANCIEDAYPILPKKWFGNLKHFHMDAYVHLNVIDGYKVELVNNPDEVNSEMKLYFINFGAYKPNEFTEYHQNSFYVAETPQKAIEKARSELCLGLDTIHKDDVVLLDSVTNELDFDVDDVLEIAEVDEAYISLKKTDSSEELKPISGYMKLEACINTN